MNKVVLIGRSTKDPELKYLPNSERAVVNFIIAVDKGFKKEGQATADFIPVIVFGKQAEATAQYVTKGKLVAVAGRIQTRNYDHKDGYKVYVTEIIADEIQFLEFTSGLEPTSDFDNKTVIDLDDIPF